MELPPLPEVFVEDQNPCNKNRWLKEVRVVFERITFEPEILGGRACIRGMRIPVSIIVGQIAYGASFDEILEGYPDLDREDIKQAIQYTAWLTQEQVVSA